MNERCVETHSVHWLNLHQQRRQVAAQLDARRGPVMGSHAWEVVSLESAHLIMLHRDRVPRTGRCIGVDGWAWDVWKHAAGRSATSSGSDRGSGIEVAESKHISPLGSS